MSKKSTIKEKQLLHPRNKNRDRYDLPTLTEAVPELKKHLKPNKKGENSIDFTKPEAVRLLNKALLNHYYSIGYWEFSEDNLTPQIPIRAEYIHQVADLLGGSNFGKIPINEQVTILDIGVGASCIYPIIGVTEYGWEFIGSDTSKDSFTSAEQIVNKNDVLIGKVTLHLQENSKNIIEGIITNEDKVDVVICNPPSHTTEEEVIKEAIRKIKSLTGKKTNSPTLNYVGKVEELVYEGGELEFITNLINESKMFAKNCFWFTCVVSKEKNLKRINKLLQQHKPTDVRLFANNTSNKANRIIAWTF